MTRIAAWNVNGLRAALKKGMPDFLDRLAPDVLLLQEIRSLPEQLPKAWQEPEGWHVAWHPAEKKGYAGTAVWSREPIEVLERGIGVPDVEGRVLTVRTAGIVVSSVYLPSGSGGDDKQARKEDWMARFRPWARALSARDEPVVMGGDLNIAHTENDIHNPKANTKNSGFLPHERVWFGELLAEGWSDTLREHVGEQRGPWSWWSNRGRARELDRGWRIDYLLANPAAAKRVSAASVFKEGGMTQEDGTLPVSDHAPVVVELT